MFELTPSAGWASSLLWLAGIALAAFLVTWVLTDRLHLHRTVYIGVLAGMAGGLTAAYLVWAGAGSDVWSNRWAWGILGAVAAGLLLDAIVGRTFRHGPPKVLTTEGLVWESGIYGVAEGLLLSVLPVLVAWQVFVAVGWNTGWRAFFGAVAAVVASVVVIVVHHLGYEEFRSVRKLRQAVIGCGVLSVVYLLVGSPITATLGHILLHTGLLRTGEVLPPNELLHRSPIATM